MSDREEYYAIPDCKPPNYTEEEKEQIRQFCESKGIDPMRIIGYAEKKDTLQGQE